MELIVFIASIGDFRFSIFFLGVWIRVEWIESLIKGKVEWKCFYVLIDKRWTCCNYEGYCGRGSCTNTSNKAGFGTEFLCVLLRDSQPVWQSLQHGETGMLALFSYFDNNYVYLRINYSRMSGSELRASCSFFFLFPFLFLFFWCLLKWSQEVLFLSIYCCAREMKWNFWMGKCSY